ncbi:tyrosine-type recombinase/integrase [Micavibrio aeruginosavorus]|uniref:Phage integrase family protein n=1 Tax=Micavibrio aeruginosavorus (strain ARL-13) TaxID=856793 RepID=G2KN05_MICAA|nr:site-specific integrase [Micavibrio aeruginosavorus]AEP08937.1 phage integrase family protein [Micavibrio aeruginosavorus ARL-13]
MAEIFAAYQDDRQGRASHEGLKYVWKNIKPYFGNLTPEQVDRGLCRDYRAFRNKAGISDGTIHRELGMLRAALRWHDPNTKAVVELPSKPAPKDRYLTRDEYRALLDAAETNHIRLFIVIALATAARAGAILDMTWDQVDFDRGLIRLSKGKESRLKGRATVPMTALARDALAQAYEARETDWVIEWAGKNVASIKTGFRLTVRRAGLDGVTPHVLRHTAAVWMAEAGIPMSEIAQYLGHTSTMVTERVYARYSPDYLRGAASALEVQM